MIKNNEIDHGKGFDWGRASSDYAKYRDIYPPQLYQKLLDMNLCTEGQNVLDLGTGTGVLPRNLYAYGASFTGTDISENQIEQAKQLADQAGMKVDFYCMPAEASDFPDQSFDVITACQCFFYFHHGELAPKLHRMLKKDGKCALIYMAWLPFEDVIAGESEELVLKYNPEWTGCREVRHPIEVPDIYRAYFELESQEIFDVAVPFTRESWNGRMKACRGIGASLTEEEIEQFDREHMALLEKIAPREFSILHYTAISVMRAK